MSDEEHGTAGETGDLALNRQLEASLREIGIPPRPRILELIIIEARAGEPDFNYLAELIQADVALAAGLVKVANSPFFGYRQKTRNVRDALLMLGLRVAANAVAGLILRRVFPPSVQLERFWDASQRTGELAAWLVKRLGVRYGVGAEDAYTFGLFRDCGIPVMMRRFSGYAQVLARANEDSERPFTAVEEAELPTNHAVVGGLMAQSWWLPEPICTAIRRHHERAVLTDLDAGGPAGRQVALAQLAEKLHQDSSGLNRSHEWDKLGAASLAVLGLDGGAEMAELETEAKEFLAHLAMAL
ncbi:HDOD domain-containing protein [Parasulfuritortus cantonensis]|uniref:HDOD domain-containing protein n=1 Tax=Parasulfuritortus cantonensis TaxID=2528202 RepID=A0A4R1BLD2_9PROT|nr:HDOD domain-containing protein [Parasulfuritortus cantonensis]TCJ18156.1 HDOD domain-containing protein [Parasulfuritortus cantonensis]